MTKINTSKTSLLNFCIFLTGIALVAGLLYAGERAKQNHIQTSEPNAHAVEHPEHQDETNEELPKENSNHKEAPKRTTQVIRVVDGDTLVVRQANGKEEHVRLIGIDAPETNPDECYARESTQALESLTPFGSYVRLEIDPSRDKRDVYGRLLAYVFVEHEVSANEEMIAQGAARELTFKGQEYLYQMPHRLAEEEAKLEKRGLWGSCQ